MVDTDFINNEGQLQTVFCSPACKTGPTSSVRMTMCPGVRVFLKAALLFPKSVHFSAFKRPGSRRLPVCPGSQRPRPRVQGFCFSGGPPSPGTEPQGAGPPLPAESTAQALAVRRLLAVRISGRGACPYAVAEVAVEEVDGALGNKTTGDISAISDHVGEQNKEDANSYLGFSCPRPHSQLNAKQPGKLCPGISSAACC